MFKPTFEACPAPFDSRRVRFPAGLTMLIALVAAVSVSASAMAQPAAAQQAPAEIAVEQRLAGEFMRAALEVAGITPLSSRTIDLACLLAVQSAELQPDSAVHWRMVLDLATLAERDELRTRAVEQISRLDPADEYVRLQKINLALNRFQTVEQRQDAYEKLLAEENVQRLGPAVASRLAYDYALLRQRMGDMDGFGRWLTRSLELDRSNRAAAALAAGFFQANIDDPFGRAEMLVNLVMTDPTDVQTQEVLAQHLLDHGAYAAARRIYELARTSMHTNRIPTSTQFMADLAVAQWAAGDVEGALATLEQRQNDIDEVYRRQQAMANRDLTIIAIGELHGPVDAELASVEAVIHATRSSEQMRAEALQRAVAAAEAAIQRDAQNQEEPSESSLAAQHLQLAFLILWLGGDSATADSHVESAAALQPLSETAEQRFTGWRALKSGETQAAIDALQPLASEDAAAGVGLALALQQAGRTRDAAAQLLALHRSQPGSMIGIWAASELTRIVGQRVSLSQHATELERLVASIPRTFDRYARDASVALSLGVFAADAEYQAYEPLLVTIELTNNTTMPLGIDRAGPLRPGTLVVPSINTAAPMALPMRPFIVELDSRLRLMPRESVTATVDLRWYGVGVSLNRVASVGGIVKLIIDTNFLAGEEGSVLPGLYGLEVQAPLIRVNGAPNDPAWLEQTRALLEDENTPQEQLMMGFALAANALHLAAATPPDDPAVRDAHKQIRAVMPAAFARLEPARQAWTLFVMDRPGPSPAVLDIARKSDSTLVRMVYLLTHVTDTNDPMIDAARRGEDPAVRRLAELLAADAGSETP